MTPSEIQGFSTHPKRYCSYTEQILSGKLARVPEWKNSNVPDWRSSHGPHVGLGGVEC